MAGELRLRQQNAKYQKSTVRKAAGANLGKKKQSKGPAISKALLYVLVFSVIGGDPLSTEKQDQE